MTETATPLHARLRPFDPPLAASAGPSITAGFPVNSPLTAESASRTIAGLVLPWGVLGRTSAGNLRAAPGSIRLPEDVGRIKLLGGGHDRETAVAYAVSIVDTPAGLLATFRVAPTEAGDRALAEAQARVRDAFSVELDDLVLEGDQIVSASLTAVALLAVPAWADARVQSVAAARSSNPSGGAVPTTDDDDTRPTPPAQPDPPEVDGDDDDDDQDDDGTQVDVQVQAAARPASLAAGSARRTRSARSVLPNLYAACVAQAIDGPMTPALTAALADITHTANAWVQPTQYDGELWSGVAYQRRIVPLFTQRALTSYKITGWRWVVRPEVDDYAGDKAPVPSNAATTEADETTALRLAGAHDIDRKFRDFGDVAFFQAYYEAMAESYAVQSDARALQWLIDNATAVGPPTADLDLLTAVTVGAFQVSNSTGSAATFALVSQDDWLSLIMGTPASDVPAFLGLLPIPPGNMIPVPDLPAGSVIVGTRPAISWYERPGSPIRVETVNLANGGIDGGVFGYYGMLLNDARGLVAVDMTVAIEAASTTSKSSS